MPHVGLRQRSRRRPSDERSRCEVAHAVERRRLAGRMTPWDHTRWPRIKGQICNIRWVATASTRYGIRSSRGMSTGRGTCGPLSMCQSWPPWVYLVSGGCRSPY